MLKSIMLRSHFSRKERGISIQVLSVDICTQFLCIFFNIAWRMNRKDNFNNQLGHCPLIKLHIKLFEPLENAVSTLFYSFPLSMSQRICTCKVTHMYKMHSSLPYSIEPVFHSNKLIIL